MMTGKEKKENKQNKKIEIVIFCLKHQADILQLFSLKRIKNNIVAIDNIFPIGRNTFAEGGCAIIEFKINKRNKAFCRK